MQFIMYSHPPMWAKTSKRSYVRYCRPRTSSPGPAKEAKKGSRTRAKERQAREKPSNTRRKPVA